MSFLYKSASGYEARHSSYSAGSDYKRCRRLFKYKRLDGYKEKKRSAAFEMGKVLESAIQFYHENGLKPGDCVDQIKHLWTKFKDVTLEYTDQEGDWSDAYGMLAAQARLYELALPTLPIQHPKFQLEYRKELWPGHPELGGLGDKAYVDMLSTLDDTTRIIIDIKNQRAPLAATENLVSLDPQLRRYAWLSGVRDVAFLWFTKARPSFKKGDEAVHLDMGRTLTVLKSDTSDLGIPVVYVGSSKTVKELGDSLDAIKGKGSTEKKDELIQQAVGSGALLVAAPEELTKCKIQFVRGIIPEDVLLEVGKTIGHEILSIRQSYAEDFWPQDTDIRGIGGKCSSCPMLGLCLKNPALVEERLVQIKKQEDDWISDLEE
jgi:hypothetical protein